MNSINEIIETYYRTEDDKKKLLYANEAAEYLKKKNVIVYGAGAAGHSIYDCVKQYDIHIITFIDRKAEQIKSVENIPVVTIQQLSNIPSDNLVFINSIDPELFLKFSDEVLSSINSVVSDYEYVSYGRNLLYMLRYAACYQKEKNCGEFNIIDCINCGAETMECPVFLHYLRRKNLTDNNRGELKNKFNKFFGYIVSRNCTLKCKYCCELVPYFKTGDFVESETILKDCERLAEASEFNMYVELVGGEPFLHPQIADILAGLLKLPNVGYVKVFTNGTVVPDKKLISVLKNDRIVVSWSNYSEVLKGPLMENVKRTRAVLEQAGIRYLYSFSETWLDFSTGFDLNTKTEEQLNNDFKECHLANCHRLYRGTLYRCPHAYAAVQMGKLDIRDEDKVELYRYEDMKALSEKLYGFKTLSHTEACRHCTLPYDAAEVPAAEQLSE